MVVFCPDTSVSAAGRIQLVDAGAQAVDELHPNDLRPWTLASRMAPRRGEDAPATLMMWRIT